MKRISLVLFLIPFSISSIYAQVLDNKLNVVFSGGISNIYGKPVINERNYIMPSLFVNYENVNNRRFKIEYKLNSVIDLCLKLENIRCTNWQFDTGDAYFKNSKTKIFFVSPAIQLHNKFKEKGIFNRLKLYLELSPLFGISKLTLTKPVFDISSTSGIEYSPILENSRFINGAEVTAGMKMTITSSIGLYTAFSYSYNHVNSLFFSDNRFTCTSINFGCFVKLFNNKHFYY